jgi:quercetin dioxygenase-like cupin family protein
MTGIAAYEHNRFPVRRGGEFAYDQWLQTLDVPVHRGYYIEDLREVEVAPWPDMGCNVAFIQLMGMEGITEAQVTEIPPGGSLPPTKFALDDTIFVVSGNGITTVWNEGGAKRTFEWGPRSLFVIPQGAYRQFSNARGDQPARIVHNNYLPLAMSLVPDPGFFYNNAYEDPGLLEAKEGELYSVAKRAEGGRGATWHGNFFTDLAAWDGLVPHRQRGGGGHVVDISFPASEMGGHMSVFPTGTYKKAHRHGPGVVIIIPSGEGYSIMWQEGQEQVVVPWHEASMFVPPNKWFHQHFNVSSSRSRYLALSPLRQTRPSERVEDQIRDQIEYPDEAPWVREKFESELAKRGQESLMPDGVYTDKDYVWTYDAEEEVGAVLFQGNSPG